MLRLPGDDEKLLLIPSIVARTAEIERAVIRIELSEAATGKVRATATIPPTPPRRARGTISRAVFFEKLTEVFGAARSSEVERFVDRLIGEHDALSEDYAQNRLAIKLEFPQTGRPPQSILYLHVDGYAHARPQLVDFARKRGVPVDVIESYFAHLADVAAGLTLPKRADGTWYRRKTDYEPLEALCPKLSQLEEAMVALIRGIETLSE